MPTYNPNGDITKDETGKQYTYDAWNRLKVVKNSGGTTLKTYTYDAMNRRVAETVGGMTTDLLYSANWQVLEERVSGTIKAHVLQFNYSPAGMVDGMLVDVDGQTCLVQQPKGDDIELTDLLAVGAETTLSVKEAKPSDKGPALLPVYVLRKRPVRKVPKKLKGLSGVVTHLNYAKHGEPNGVILDGLHFVHLKPEGMTQFGLVFGDTVLAEGETWPMDNGGRLVEATKINGKAVKLKHPKPHG